MIKTKIHRKNLFTPLRYPGGKTSLFQFFDEIIKLNHWSNVKYIEPYAGGAGAALSLLLLEKVESIVINDLDVAIYAFWKSSIEETDKFIDKINTTPLTVNEWRHQKEIYNKKDLNQILALGFATFYLNRTNRSGIMNAGPIGGINQAGNYKIDARYNSKNLIEKIRLIALYKDRITVLNQDGIKVIEKYAKNKNSFLYIDPPYYKQGSGLYMNFFDDKQHKELAKTLKKHSNAKWILTYDNVPEILKMYSSFNKQQTFPLKYSAHHASIARELMIFSDSVDISKLSSGF